MLKDFYSGEALERHKPNCFEFHKVPEQVSHRCYEFNNFGCLRDIPVQICFDTEAFDSLISKLEPNLVKRFLPMTETYQITGFHQPFACAVILTTNPEYLHFMKSKLF